MNKWKVNNPNTTFVVVDEKFNHFIAEAADIDVARLIATAPELLEVLEKTLMITEAHIEICQRKGLKHSNALLVAKEARNAIAKALGHE